MHFQALACCSAGLCSSGHNGTVVIWDVSRGTTLWALDLKTLCVEGMDRLVHAVSLSEQVRPPRVLRAACSAHGFFCLLQNGTLLIGTSTCEIVTVDITAPDTAPTVLHFYSYIFLPSHRRQVHLHSHSGAVTGLCVSPLENCAVTVSRLADGIVDHGNIRCIRLERIVPYVFGTWSSGAWKRPSTWACGAGVCTSALTAASMPWAMPLDSSVSGTWPACDAPRRTPFVRRKWTIFDSGDRRQFHFRMNAFI